MILLNFKVLYRIKKIFMIMIYPKKELIDNFKDFQYLHQEIVWENLIEHYEDSEIEKKILKIVTILRPKLCEDLKKVFITTLINST